MSHPLLCQRGLEAGPEQGGAERGVVASVEGWLGKRAAKLGWRPEFPFAIIGDWIERKQGARLLERRALAPIGLFTLVRIARDA